MINKIDLGLVSAFFLLGIGVSVCFFFAIGVSVWFHTSLYDDEKTACEAQETRDLAAAFSVKDDIFLLDVREPEEFAASAFAGAVNIPLGQIEARLAEIPTDRRIFVICRSGRRSAAASEVLVRKGYRNVTNVEGGMNKWYAEISHKKGC